MLSSKISVVFPGQGSQYPEMLKEYLKKEISFREIFSFGSEILGVNLEKLLMSGNDEDLSRTEITQPIMLIADLALWNLISPYMKNIVCLAGHSLGEYSALVASGSLLLEDAIKLVKKRALLMQKFTPKEGGGIAAIIGLDKNKAMDACNEISLNKDCLVNVANLNSPNQIVISGTKTGVSLAIDKCKEMGARRGVHLPMSVPAHSELMIPAANKLSNLLEEITFLEPKIPVLHNVDSSLCEDPVKIKVKLTKQMYSPVLWTDTVNAIIKLGVDKIYECGPGKVLIGLIKRINSQVELIDLDNYKNYLAIKNV